MVFGGSRHIQELEDFVHAPRVLMPLLSPDPHQREREREVRSFECLQPLLFCHTETTDEPTKYSFPLCSFSSPCFSFLSPVFFFFFFCRSENKIAAYITWQLLFDC